MTFGNLFSFRRFHAIISKEFVQMRRDRVTFAMMIGIPILQMVIFGFAINSDPEHLPTVILTADNSVFSRTIVAAMQNSGYFKVIQTVTTENEADVSEFKGYYGEMILKTAVDRSEYPLSV